MSKKQQKIIYKNNLPKLNNHIFDPAKFAFNTQILILGPILGTIPGLILGSVLGSINIQLYFLVTSIGAADAGNPYTSLELILKSYLFHTLV